jgi:hypothetical protein
MKDQDYFAAPFQKPLIHGGQWAYISGLGYYEPYYKSNAVIKCN